MARSNLFRMGVLGSSSGWYMKDLQRAASECVPHQSVAIEPLSFNALSVHNRFFKGEASSEDSPPRIDSIGSYRGGSQSGGSYAKSESGFFRGVDVWSTRDAVNDVASQTAKTPEPINLHKYDAILVRTMPLGSLEQTIFRMNALHATQHAGVLVLNSPRCLEIAIDKWLTLDVAQRSGALTPRTICCQTRDDALAAFDMLGGDCVVKPIFGGEGRGIVRVSDREMAWRVFSTLEQINSVIYIQEFLESVGYDLRLLVVGDEIFCIRRQNENDWRSNVACGGKAVPHEPTFEQIDIAFRVCKAIGGWMVGVDILPTHDGRDILIEANAVPGWRATASALGVDMAALVLERLRTGKRTGLGGFERDSNDGVQ